MTEFAFSVLGLYPHHGTPAIPWDRERRRIPGGSSSGAAVSVADGMAHGALGTDTGGSCRIPAALCGLVGFKATQARIPREGMVPLSKTLDAVGTLGNTVACCAILDSLLAGKEPRPPEPLDRPPRLAVVRDYFGADCEPAIIAAFDRATGRLGDAGAQLAARELPELAGITGLNGGGGFAAAESFVWHHHLVSTSPDDYDPRVLVRIKRGEQHSAADLLVLRDRRAALIDGVTRRLEGFDAFICPTVPLVAPPIEALADDDEYTRINLLMLRNPTVINLLDGCAASVPMHRAGEPPTGLMVAGLAHDDPRVLSIASWIEEQI
jgi:aspartyl-tRNA(Asn)/glutamyl-tRNA(Gln) amidotransferase subunit A